MTYNDFIINSTPIPKTEQSILNICHDSAKHFYQVYGNWHGKRIFCIANSYKQVAEAVRTAHGVCIPPRKDLIFSHTHKGRKYAMIQGFLPGSAVVDVSGYYVR